ncbi:Xylose operon regulatory protein [Sedimentisphaera cyanobacteriorum]|uniref:Xylose operon regulatory protein n=1 Tax=Sedimentisphaera cyanobacteriorum TaxID=1940790 RepID=A0A1Q2HMR0_9BACT|nr:DNA-binding transcriptional regulator [Sedimentisphaera cyanobacteriorum]AQQ08544.1 Xylose operon regulatory protein [Sedimentisphaera cyanobacteriorum]
MQHTKRIALLIETSTSYGRALIRGILTYANIATNWVFYNEPSGFADSLPELSAKSFDGIIMRDTSENMKLLKLGVPAIVSIRYQDKIAGVPNIVSNSSQIGAMAASYFRNKGFENFAYCGFENMPWSHERKKAFAASLPSGCRFESFSQQSSGSYEKQIQSLSDWLASLEKPSALMACNDVRGATIIEACKLAGLKIPQEISILGVNNDDMICEMVSPQLSSISLNIVKAGSKAAQCLDNLIKGKTGSEQRINVEADGIVSRASTDLLAINDPAIAQALHFITQNRRQHLQVSEVAEYVGVNRRSLERRFKAVLNTSVYEQIKSVRINTICKMLTQTSIPISEISYSMGFNDANHIARYFKQKTGITPLQYRKQYSAMH